GGVSDGDRDVAAVAVRGLRARAPPELLESGWHRCQRRDRRLPRVPLAPPRARARAGRAAPVNVVAAAKKLSRVIPEAVERFFADQCSQLAAGIAYRVLFSLAPVAIVLVSGFRLVLQDETLPPDGVDAVVDALPGPPARRRGAEDRVPRRAPPASATRPGDPR